MNFQTSVDIPVLSWHIGYTDRILMLGSCFSDNIARKAHEYWFQVEANPFGTLYNPVSIAHHISQCADKADVIIVTFGSAWVYIDKALAAGPADLNAVVDNCEKRPATDFWRYRLTVDDIVGLWRPVLDRYKDKRWLFTVSPIRHKKDGLHENQISKGILLQAVEALNVDYFPSYEIMLDELRDYRFYAADMLHPSDVAIDYLWEKFVACCMSPDIAPEMRMLHQYWLDCAHRPLHPESEEARRFADQLAERKRLLLQSYPWIGE